MLAVQPLGTGSLACPERRSQQLQASVPHVCMCPRPHQKKEHALHNIAAGSSPQRREHGQRSKQLRTHKTKPRRPLTLIWSSLLVTPTSSARSSLVTTPRFFVTKRRARTCACSQTQHAEESGFGRLRHLQVSTGDLFGGVNRLFRDAVATMSAQGMEAKRARIFQEYSSCRSPQK